MLMNIGIYRYYNFLCIETVMLDEICKKLGKMMEKTEEYIKVEEELLTLIAKNYPALIFNEKYEREIVLPREDYEKFHTNRIRYLSPYLHEQKNYEYGIKEYWIEDNIKMVLYLINKNKELSLQSFCFLRTLINRYFNFFEDFRTCVRLNILYSYMSDCIIIQNYWFIEMFCFSENNISKNELKMLCKLSEAVHFSDIGRSGELIRNLLLENYQKKFGPYAV